MKIQIYLSPLVHPVTIGQLNKGFSGNQYLEQVTVNTVAIQDIDNNKMTIADVIVNHKYSSKEVPLYISSRYGNQLLLKLLIHHGTNINLVDGHERTNTRYADEGGHAKYLVLLIDSKEKF